MIWKTALKSRDWLEIWIKGTSFMKKYKEIIKKKLRNFLHKLHNHFCMFLFICSYLLVKNNLFLSPYCTIILNIWVTLIIKNK